MGLFGKKADAVEAEATHAPRAAAGSWKGASALEPLLVPVGELRLDEANVRKHPERNVEAIKASLDRFGQRKPVVARDGVVVAGNGTLEAALKLGWTHLAAVDAGDLTAEEARAFSIADNKTGDLAEWDYQSLAEQFREMPEELLAATGFGQFEIEPLLQAEWKPPAVEAGAPPPGQSAGTVVVHVSMTKEQHRVCEQAVDKLRAREEDSSMTFGRALELICADYLAGA